MKKILFISLFFLVINNVSADNTLLIDNYEIEIDNFASTYRCYYKCEPLLLQWQSYASNALQIYKNITSIKEDNDDAFSISEIDRIEQLTNKFKSAFLINDSINRYETLINDFETVINRYAINKTNINSQTLNIILEQLIQEKFYIKIHQAVGVFPFNKEQLNKLEILVEKNGRLTAMLRQIMQNLNIC